MSNNNQNHSFLFYKPEFELERAKFENFLRTFTDKSITFDNEHENRKYMIELVIFLIIFFKQKISNKKSKVLEIYKEDLEFFFSSEKDSALLDQISKNTKRYIKLFQEACDKVMPPRSLRNIQLEEIEPIEEVYMNQRMANIMTLNQRQPDQESIPPELLRK